MAQLVERSLQIPEIRGLNPVIGKALSTKFLYHRKDENKEKEAGNGPSLKKQVQRRPKVILNSAVRGAFFLQLP